MYIKADLLLYGLYNFIVIYTFIKYLYITVKNENNIIYNMESIEMPKKGGIQLYNYI